MRRRRMKEGIARDFPTAVPASQRISGFLAVGLREMCPIHSPRSFDHKLETFRAVLHDEMD